MKNKLGINVYEASLKRINFTFDNFEKIYLSFSAGKDSTVMPHIVLSEAKKRNIKVGILFIDLEAQYIETIEHAKSCFEMYKDHIELFWIQLPIKLRNSVSMYEPVWTCWDKEKKELWVREQSMEAITDSKFFDFFHENMEFEEFVPLFGDWYSKGKKCACFVGIRSDESLNRYRTIASKTKTRFKNKIYTTKVTNKVYNVYPIYDWKTEDLWIYHGKNKDLIYNKIYDKMYQAGLTIHQMRLCQPYGDDQRKGLWLYHILEPQNWGKIVARVNGANSGSLYVQESGNIMGYGKVTLPPNHTWESFAKMLLKTLPDKSRLHFENKILVFIKWWVDACYHEGIPDQAPLKLENRRLVPSWRRICKSILRNDYWCKGLGFSQTSSEAYNKYIELMKKRKNAQEWSIAKKQLETSYGI